MKKENVRTLYNNFHNKAPSRREDIFLFCSCGNLTKFMCRSCGKFICPDCGGLIKYGKYYRSKKQCNECNEKLDQLGE